MEVREEKGGGHMGPRREGRREVKRDVERGAIRTQVSRGIRTRIP